jgi:hypothetical protein
MSLLSKIKWPGLMTSIGLGPSNLKMILTDKNNQKIPVNSFRKSTVVDYNRLGSYSWFQGLHKHHHRTLAEVHNQSHN